MVAVTRPTVIIFLQRSAETFPIPFSLTRANAHVILSGARDSARREGPAFPRVAADPSFPHDEFEQQGLRACGAQDDRLYALLEKEKKEERATRRTCSSSCRSGSLLSS